MHRHLNCKTFYTKKLVEQSLLEKHVKCNTFCCSVFEQRSKNFSSHIFTQIRQSLNTELSAISTTFYLSASGQTITQVLLHCSFYGSLLADTQK